MPATNHVGAAPPRTRQLLLVVNAHASGARRELVGGVEEELRRLGARVRTLVTESSDEWVEALREDAGRRLVLVGGDGTLHAAADTAGLRPETALVPAGRANNVARSLGIPLSPRDAARLAVEGAVRPIDLIEARTLESRRATVEAVSLGFLAEARSRYHEENSAHLGSALAAGAQALASFHPLHVRLELPDGQVELELTQLFVANLPLYGFGLHVARAADPTDELLDVVAVDAHSRVAIPALIGRLRSDRGLDGRPDVHHWLAESARIVTEDRSHVVADSYDLGSGALDVRVLPKRLRIVRP